MMQGLNDLKTLRDEFLAAVPRVGTPEERRVALRLYRLLARGSPVAARELAEAAGISEPQVQALMDEWPGVFCDEAGRVQGFWGLAIPQMSHSLEIDGRTLYAWCAWDTLFIPQLVGGKAHVTSKCPQTGKRVTLDIGPEGVSNPDPSQPVVSFLIPDAGDAENNIIESFCHHVFFLASGEAGAEWLKTRDHTFLLSLEDAFALGRMVNEARYGAELG